MDEEQKINGLANTLFSKGLAASLWDAKNKAREILGLTNQKMMQTDGSISPREKTEPKEESVIDDIMKGAGVNVSDLKKAEDEKIEQIKSEFQEKLGEEDKVTVFDAAEGSSTSEVSGIEKVELPKDIFIQPSEGLDPEMTVAEAAGVEIEKSEEPQSSNISMEIEPKVTEEPDSELAEFYEDNSSYADASGPSEQSEQIEVKETEPLTNGDDMVDIEEHYEKEESNSDFTASEELKESNEEPAGEDIRTNEIENQDNQSGLKGAEEEESKTNDNYFYLSDNKEADAEERFSEEVEKEEIPKILDEEFKEMGDEPKTIILEGKDDNVFSDVDNDKVDGEKGDDSSAKGDSNNYV